MTWNNLLKQLKIIKYNNTLYQMTPQTVVATHIVDQFTYAMMNEDVDAMLDLWAPNGVWVIMATGEMFNGLDQIRELAVRSVAARHHRSREGLLPFNVFASEDGAKFCWEYIHKGIVTERWPSSPQRPKNGTKFDVPIVLVCEVSRGKIFKIREYFDLLTITEATCQHHLYS